MMTAEGFLQIVEFSVGRRKAANGLNAPTASLNGKGEAAAGRLAVKQNRTRAANALLARDVHFGAAKFMP